LQLKWKALHKWRVLLKKITLQLLELKRSSKTRRKCQILQWKNHKLVTHSLKMPRLLLAPKYLLKMVKPSPLHSRVYHIPLRNRAQWDQPRDLQCPSNNIKYLFIFSLAIPSNWETNYTLVYQRNLLSPITLTLTEIDFINLR
jgi:hypothetical protein